MDMPAIVLPCYNRPESLRYLLKSLLLAKYSGFSDVPLVFCIDNSGVDDVVQLAQMFEWPHGPKLIHHHEERLGIRKNIIFCGDLTEVYGAVVVLEDDLIVSREFYRYACEARSFYEAEEKVAQISLYAYEYGEICLERFHPLKVGYDVYFMQWASSSGQLWTKGQWRKFKVWYEAHVGCDLNGYKIPEYVKRWPETSWKKYFIAYLVDSGTYAVYPYYSLVTNYGDSGENVRAGSLPVVQTPLVWQLPDILNFCPFAQSLVKYDCFFQPTAKLIDGLTDTFIDYQYDVDLQGSKRLSDISSEYLISVKPCRNPLYTFSWNVFPFELSVSLGCSGQQISFGKTVDFSPKLPRYKFVLLALWTKRILGVPMSLYCNLIKLYYKLLGK